MNDNQRIQHIDGWRFIAVVIVLLSHIIIFSNFSFLVENYPFLRRLGRFGELGVLIFFFISGFVICRGLIEERTSTACISLKAFYVRRALRIIPPLYVYLASLALLAAVGAIDITHAQIAKSAFFLCNMDLQGGCSWFAGHTWSLGYEEQFYLIFPVVFVMLGLVLIRKTLILIILLMVITSLGFRWSGADWTASYLMYMIFMLTGCAAALYWHQLSLWRNRLSSRHWVIALILLLVCVGLLPYPIEAYVKTVLYPPLIGLLVLSTTVAPMKVKAFFQDSIVSYLGKISYTVYLWQQLATAPYATLSTWWTIIFVIGVWILAHFSYQYFERPLIALARRRSSDIKQRYLAKRATPMDSI